MSLEKLYCLRRREFYFFAEFDVPRKSKSEIFTSATFSKMGDQNSHARQIKLKKRRNWRIFAKCKYSNEQKQVDRLLVVRNRFNCFQNSWMFQKMNGFSDRGLQTNYYLTKMQLIDASRATAFSISRFQPFLISSFF